MAGSTRPSTCAPCALRAKPWPTHDGLADFAFAMQGLGTGADHPVRLRRPEGALPAAGRAGRGDRRLCALGAGGRVGRGGHEHDGDPGRAGSCADRRGEDLDLQWRHRRPLRGLRALRRGARREGAVGLRGRCATRPGSRIESRIDVIAPHPLATLRFEGCRVPLAKRIGGPGEGFKVAMATLDVFRSTVGAAALGLGAPRAGRGACSTRPRASSSARRSATCR